MGMGIPFDDNAMTIILGLGDPMDPGMHGPMKSPMPDKTAIDLITSIRDMCDEWLCKCGKCEDDDSGSAGMQVDENEEE